MGIDLRIIPMDHQGSDFGFTILECDSCFCFFNQVRLVQKAHGVVVAEGFVTYVKNKVSRKHHDRFGDPLQCVEAGPLKNIALRKGVTPRNKAVLSYIQQLDDAHKCVLYWY